MTSEVSLYTAIDPRREAFERLGQRYDVLVLEPSPPAVIEAPWFADDPLDPGPRTGRPLVSPVATGDLQWDELARDDAALGEWCAQRWLGAHRRLGPLPSDLVQTRSGLHLVAAHVISPTRQRANGKIGLRYVRGGFGTPFFGNDVQLRVAGDALTVQVAGRCQSGRLTTIKDAAEFIGFDLTRSDLVLDARPLEVDPVASRFLGDWFGFATSVLEQLRAEASSAMAPSRPQLWPEHFDVAVEIGAEATGGRAAYGCSPGDELHPEPYLYVAPWTARPSGELWSATGFAGAQLVYAELMQAPDQREAALEFFRARVAALATP